MANPNIIGKSGTKVTEIRSGRMRADGSAVNMNGVQNPYLDGKRISVGSGDGKGFRDGVSCGFGPSKLHARTDMPELNDLETAIIMTVNQFGGLNTMALQAMIPVEGDEEEVNKTWKKTLQHMDLTYICHTAKNGGGWSLMAEGRRVAGLIEELEAEKKNKGT